MAMTGGTAKLVKTGTLDYGNSNATVKLYVYYKTSQDITNNKSTITCGMYITVSSGWTIGKWDDFNGSYIGTTGNTFSGTISSGTSGTKWLVENKTFTVAHNNDGSGKATIYWKWGVNSPWGQIVTPSGSFTITLPTIPRASSLSLSTASVNVGSSITANIARASSNFTHTVKFFIKGKENSYSSQQYEAVATSQSFVIPSSWYNAMPSTTSCTACCRISTYNGGSKIGSDVVKEFTVNVPSSIVPSITSNNITLDPVNITINGTSYDYLVKGKNKISVSVSGCNAGSGSTIKSYVFSGPSISTTTTSTSVSVGPVSQYGTLTYKITVTDTRGRSSSASKNITCYNYYNPSFTSFNATRDKTTLSCSCKIACADIDSKNFATVKIYVDGSLAHTISNIANGTSANATIDLADADTAYDVYAVVIDSLGSSAKTETATILGAARIFNAAADGNGFAIGKMSEQDGFECGWDAKFYSDCEIDGSLVVGTSTQSTAPTNGIAVHDIRDAEITPDSFGDKNANFYFDQINGVWHSVIHMKGWTGDYAAWELAGNANNGSELPLKYRQGRGDTVDSWGDWQTIVTDKNIGSYALLPSGAAMTGQLYLGANLWYQDGVSGLNCQNSDIINANALYFQDASDSDGEGINFYNASGKWDTLYTKDGVLMYQPARSTNTGLSGYKVPHAGLNDHQLYNGSFTTGSLTFNYGNYRAYAIIGRTYASGSCVSLYIPKAAILTNDVKYQLVDETHYYSFNLKHNDNIVTLSFVNRSSDGFIGRIYGVY